MKIKNIDDRITDKIEVRFEGGQSRDRTIPGTIMFAGVNYMLATFEDDDGDDVELYAEYMLNDDEGVDSDAGYDELKAEIIAQAAEHGISADMLQFYYD